MSVTRIDRIAVSACLALAAVPCAGQSSASPFTSGLRYDQNGRVTGTLAPDPDGTGALKHAAVRNTYDGKGRLIKVETGELANWQSEAIVPSAWSGFTVFNTQDIAYDAAWRKVQTRSAGGNVLTVQQYSYDAANRPECAAVRMNAAVFSSLPASACTLSTQGVNGPDRINKSSYDAASQLVQEFRAWGTPLQQAYATYGYSLNGRRTAIIDAGGNKATMSYDGHDRQVAWNFPSPTSPGTVSTTDYEAYGYDANSNRTSYRKRDGRTLTYSFDALNRVTLKMVPDGSGLPTAATRDVYYGYDLRGLRTYARFDSATGEGVSNTWDGFGRQTAETSTMGGVTRTFTSGFDANGNRTSLSYPGGVSINFTYDGLDRMLRVLEGSTQRDAFVYDAAGHRSGRLQGDVFYNYDGIDRLTSTGMGAGRAFDWTDTFAYNPASQIVSRARSNDSYRYTNYRNAANTYGSNGLNQYSLLGSASVTYDPNGNLLSSDITNYTYDVENRMIAAYNGTSMVYDPLGRLVRVTKGTSDRWQAYDGDRLSAEYDTSGTVLRRFVHSDRTDEPLLWYEGATLATPRWTIADAQGSIVLIVDSSYNIVGQNGYDEFGQPNRTNVGRFQYTGQQWVPELFMYYYKARIYEPNMGRYMQVDPVGYDDHINLYAYVANDPVNGRDPTGNACEKPGGGPCPNADDHTFRDQMAAAGAAAGAIVGGVAGGTAGGTGGAVAGAACGPGAVACSPVGAAAGATAGAAAGAAGGAVAGGVVGGLIGAAIDKGIVLFNKVTGDASTPTGRRGSPIDVEPGTNAPTRIAGREYSGHSLDRMQGSGVTPSVVESAIQNGTRSAGNVPGTFMHAGDRVTVITNSAGRVITVIMK